MFRNLSHLEFVDQFELLKLFSDELLKWSALLLFAGI
jgi:hypothetical protein